MFCSACGHRLEASHRYCGLCGKPVGSVAPWPQAPDDRLRRHLQLLGLLWMALGVVKLLGAGLLFALSRSSVFLPHDEFGIHELFAVALSAISGFLLVSAVLAFAAGYGLLEHESWARPLALVLGFLALLNFPLGTALGVFTLWVLLPADSREEFRRLAHAD